MGGLRQHGFALFAALLFAAAVVLGIVAGKRWARHATPPAPADPEAAITLLAVEPCPLDPGITVYICSEPFRVSWRDGSGGARCFRVELTSPPAGSSSATPCRPA